MGKKNITILTGSDKRMQDCCDLCFNSILTYTHKWEHSFSRAEFKRCIRPPSWYKIPAVLDCFESPTEFVMWVDADAGFVSTHLDIADFLTDDTKDLFIAKDSNGINCGVFVIRVNSDSQKLLTWAWNAVEFVNHQWWEQAAIANLIAIGSYPESKIQYLEKHIWNAYPTDVNSTSMIFHIAGSPGDKYTQLKQRVLQ